MADESSLIDGTDLDAVLDGGTFSSTNPTFETPTAGFLDSSWSCQFVPVPRAISPTTGFYYLYDRIYNQQVSSVIKDDKIFHLIQIDKRKPKDLVLSLDNSGLATFRRWGAMTQLEDGTTNFVLNSDNFTGVFPVTFRQTSGDFHEFLDFAGGSLAKHMNLAVSTRLEGKDAATTNFVYNYYNPPVTGYSRNPNFFLSGIDLSFLPNWNSNRNSPAWCGVLITPRHILISSHTASYPAGGYVQVGDEFHFTSMDNVSYSRTVVAATGFPWGFYPSSGYLYSYFGPNGPDISVLQLDSDLPSDIKPIKIIPTGTPHYLPTTRLGSLAHSSFPEYLSETGWAPQYAVSVNQFRIGGIKYLASDFTYPAIAMNTSRYVTEPYEDFMQVAITNDSSSPVFLLVNDEAILTHLISFSSSAGTNVAIFANHINDFIQQMGSSHRLTTGDFSSFTYYSSFL